MSPLNPNNDPQGLAWSLRVLFCQHNFNAYASVHPWAARCGATLFALVVLACLVADVVALPKHLANRNLRQNGLSVAATVDRVDVRSYFAAKSTTPKYETTVHYHFTTQDGRRYDGTSKVDTLERPLVSRGTGIPVFHNPANPSENAWSNALVQTRNDLFVLMGITTIVTVCLGLFVYRFVRWWPAIEAIGPASRRRRISRRGRCAALQGCRSACSTGR